MAPPETEKRRERKERDPKEAKERKERRERKERGGEKDDKAKTHKLSLKGSARLVAEFVGLPTCPCRGLDDGTGGWLFWFLC